MEQSLRLYLERALAPLELPKGLMEQSLRLYLEQPEGLLERAKRKWNALGLLEQSLRLPGTRFSASGTPLGAPNPYDAIAAKRDTTRTAISILYTSFLY